MFMFSDHSAVGIGQLTLSLCVRLFRIAKVPAAALVQSRKQKKPEMEGPDAASTSRNAKNLDDGYWD
ncbi:hypothetical protein MKZ38_000968 [Zalerion maritima]|uniref:Uncharacterized protein n=1 Tax=Zalerion maritima TaxID=339359 RepID=A0AAD5RRL1_9PEZI|nr:hypothetical protein MKZ38_000968 [Zalerion maritima]